MRFKRCAVLTLVAMSAHAQTPLEPPSPQVIVSGRQTEVEASRDFIAGTIVIGRQRILESGVQSSGELLAREPAVSIGKDGRPGLLGMAGYTQITVDGAAYQGDPLSIDVVRIERIEIIKSSTAVTGPIGIAGTINIVLRKTGRKAITNLSGGAARAGGLAGGNFTLASNQVLADNALSYNWTLSALNKPTIKQSQYSQARAAAGAGLVPEFAGGVDGISTVRLLIGSSELLWTINADHKISISPELGHVAVVDDSLEQRRFHDGTTTSVRAASDSANRTWSVPLLWDWQINADRTFALKLQMNGAQTGTGSQQNDTDVHWTTQQRRHDEDIQATNYFVNADYTASLDGGHDIAVGAKFIRNDSVTHYADTIDGQPDVSLVAFGSGRTTRLDRQQVFAQDEWRINRRLAVNVGLSVEHRAYDLDEGPFRSEPQFTMWSPSVHLSQKINGDSKRQVRLSLARSYSPPETDQLLLHPTINAFAPCVTARLCGANSIDTFDTAGNPALQPERALGLNLSYTHGVGANSEVLVEYFQRNIHDKTGFSYDLADVPWSSTQRYVLRPANLGTALVRGINVETRLVGKDISPILSQSEIHGSVGVARSTLSDLPGPDNHLADQLPWRAKLGGSYTLRAAPIKFGIEASFLPGDWVQYSRTTRVYQSSKATLGANASWKVNETTSVTALLDNLLQQHTSRIDAWQDNADYVERATSNTSYTRFALRVETAL